MHNQNAATALAEGVLHTAAKEFRSVENALEKDIRRVASTGRNVAQSIRRSATSISRSKEHPEGEDFDSNGPDSTRQNEIDVAALTASVLHNLKQITDADALTDDFDRENYIDTTWINTIVKELWKHIEASGRKILHEEVLPKMRNEVRRSAKIFKKFGMASVNPDDVGVEQFFLGDKAASVGATRLQRKSYVKPDGSVAQALQLDVALLFDDAVAIVVNAGFLVLEIVRMRFSGELTILMRPLVKDLPIIAGVQLFFLNTPDISYEFKVSGEKPSRTVKVLLNLVKDNIKRSVMNAVESAFVVPNRKTLKMKVSREISAGIDWDTICHGQPLGILRVRLSKATKLKSADFSLFRRGGSSDPYGVMRLGSQQQTTSVVYGKLSPFWHELEWYDFIVYSSRQKLRVELFDRDFGSADDTLGRFPFLTILQFLSEASIMADGKTYELTKELDLSEVDDAKGITSTGTLQFRWMNLSKTEATGPRLEVKDNGTSRLSRAGSWVMAEPKPKLSSTCLGRARAKTGRVIDSNKFQLCVMLIILLDISYNSYILLNQDAEEQPLVQWIINLLLAAENLSRMFYLSPSIFFRNWMCVLEFLIVVVSLIFQVVEDSHVINPTFLRALRPAIRWLKTLKTLITMRSHMQHRDVFVPKDFNVALLSIDIHGARGFPPDLKGIKVHVTCSVRSTTVFSQASRKSRIELPKTLGVDDVDQHLQTTIGRMVLLDSMPLAKVASLTDLDIAKVEAVMQSQMHTFMRWDQTICALLTDPLNTDVELELRDGKGTIGRATISLKDNIGTSTDLVERAAYELRLIPQRIEEFAMRTGLDPSLVQCFMCVTFKLRYLQPSKVFGAKLLAADLLDPAVTQAVPTSELLAVSEKRLPFGEAKDTSQMQDSVV